MPLIAVAAITAGGALAGGIMAKKGADNQANAIDKATTAANAQNMAMFNQNRADEMPWMTAGSGAVSKLAGLLGVDTTAAKAQFQQNSTDTATNKLAGLSPSQALALAQSGGDPNISPSREVTQDWVAKGIPFTVVNGIAVKTAAPNDVPGQTMTAQPGQASDFGSLLKPFGMSDFQQDPGYQFRLSEGQKALDRSAASKGMMFSGANIKAATNYNQNAAADEYTNAYNRYQTNQGNIYNRLASLAGMGQTSVNTMTNQGTQLAGLNSQLTFQGGIGAANARASGYAALGQGIQNAGNSALQAYFMKQNGLFGGGGGGLSSGGGKYGSGGDGYDESNAAVYGFGG